MLPPPETRDDPRWNESWDYLCSLYTPAMVRYVRSVLSRRLGRSVDEDEAADVVQDYLTQAFEKGWLSKDDEDIRCFRAYLQAQLSRFATSYLRHKFAKKRSPAGVEAAEVLDRVAAEDADLAAELDAGWVESIQKQVLARLLDASATYYEIVLDLLRTDGEGSADLAERIGKPESRMKDLRHRARRRFALLFYEELRLSVRDDEAYEDLCSRLEPHLP